jgi:tetratricopeptide (TPR) repeat protein
MRVPSPSSLCAIALVASLLGCSELSARRHGREGNRHYLEGDYATALKEYTRAEELLPTLPVLVLNKGLACRQLMMPGAKSPENDRAATCALAAFARLQQLVPKDPRGEQLYVQTLFDADRFEELAALYQRQLQARPDNLSALNGLIQVYSRWDRWDDAYRQIVTRANTFPGDAELQYSVGVYVWNRLFQKGGSGDRASFDPRPEAKQVPPPVGEGDIVGDQRAKLADEGIAYLQKALAIRPKYREAMTYLNLLYRQKSYAFFDRPAEWQACIQEAERFRIRATELDAAHPGAQH